MMSIEKGIPLKYQVSYNIKLKCMLHHNFTPTIYENIKTVFLLV